MNELKRVQHNLLFVMHTIEGTQFDLYNSFWSKNSVIIV